MSQFHNDPEDSSDKQWDQIHFRSTDEIATPGIRTLPKGPYGNARLATRKELLGLAQAAARNPENYIQLFEAHAIAHDPQVSVATLEGLTIPFGKDSPNLLVVGRSGAGKTQKVIFPAACHAIREGWSMVYINIKGKSQTRLLRKLADAYDRAKEVTLVAPQKPNRTIGWTAIEGCSKLSEAGDVAACLVGNAASTSRFGEGAWAYNQAEEWLQHAIAAVCSDNPKNRRNLWEIRKVVLSGEYSAFAAEHPDYEVLAKFGRYVTNGNKNAETITATISEATSFIDEVAPFLSKPELNLDRFVDSGGILIVEIDEYAVKKLRTVIALFLSRILATIQRKACDSPSGQLPHKTVVLIDELAASGPIYGLDTSLHTCRERRYGFIAGVQSISQIPAIYGKDTDVVLSGFQSQVVLSGGLDIGSAEYFCRRSGVTTIAVPSAIEEPDAQSNTMVAHGWTLAPRSLLLPADIHSAQEHHLLGAPATVFLGDGKTPPFQAYLTAAHDVGQISLMMEDIAKQKVDDDLRSRPLQARQPGDVKQPKKVNGFTQTNGWSDKKIWKKIEEIKESLSWSAFSTEALEWWSLFEKLNVQTPRHVLRYIEELEKRKATVEELLDAAKASQSRKMDAIIIYLDYMRLTKEPSPAATEVKTVTNLISFTETTGIAVQLLSFKEQKLGVVKAVKGLIGLSLMDAKKLVESAPVVIGRCKHRLHADRVVREIAEAGGLARVID
jgi:type IV secretory pathway TraG/TraD family ATPase VirD4/ribosomal protein L7/L12